MVTPFSQVVGTQAVMNVIAGERYANVPDEVIRYAIGRFGTPPAPMEPNVRDRITQLPRARELAAQPPMPEPAELRKRFAPGIGDEEFLLRAVMPADQVDAMKAAGPCRTDYSAAAAPVERLLRELAKRPDVTHARIEKPGFRLELRRTRPAGHTASTHAPRAERRAAPSRPAIPSGAEPGRGQSGGLSSPGEGLSREARRGLQGRPTYPSVEGQS
jgi:oxaloacetate decarboxylase alpha subunit